MEAPQETLILVADDDDAFCRLLRDFMKLEGFRVEQVCDGFQCLESIRTCKPRVVLLDGDMPVLDGWDTCRKIKSAPETQHVQVIMISAHARARDEERALACGATRLLSKPVDLEELLSVVKGLAESK